MTKILPTYPRILGIAPSSKGFGFAVVEGLDMLADWGVKTVKGEKNARAISKLEELMALYQPDVVVLEDTSVTSPARCARIRALTKRIAVAAKRRQVAVHFVTQEQLRSLFFGEGRGTKQALAGIVADKFSEELGFRLPRKRRPWMSEDYRMAIFEAVALALMVRRGQRSGDRRMNPVLKANGC